MMEYSISDTGILTVHPDAPLEAEDFRKVTLAADAWLESGTPLRGVLIDAPEFPGWKDFNGLAAHLRFVKDHHREISRVAIVSDSAAASILPKLAKHFVSAELKHFPAGKQFSAIQWLKEAPDSKGGHLAYSWEPARKLVILTANGKIGTAEYQDFLAWFEGVVEAQTPVSCLIHIDNLEGAELGAMMADLKFGLTHIGDFKRIALTGDKKWIHRIASFPNPFPIEIRAFDEGQEEEAWSWAAG